MDEQVLVATRKSLHGAAELLLAGPQYRAHGTIKLHVTPGGFGAVAAPPRVAGGDLVWPEGRVALAGSCRDLAALIGVDAAPPGNYPDTGGLAPDGTPLHIRMDGAGLDAMDVPDGSLQAKLQFAMFVPTADFFARLRRDQASLDLVQAFAVDPRHAGVERFITATRRQNFLVPPRRHRAFPLVELVR